MSLIIYAIPVFFLLIGIELVITKTQKLSYYRMNDAITNLSCGIGSQITGVFLKTVTFIGYQYLYEHSIWKIENNIFSFIVLFIGVDFFYYWFHRLAHEIPFLWGSHVVHHQSEEYNLTVALRQAWLQGAFSWVFYLPLAMVGFSPGAFLVVASLQTLYQFWIHTRLIGKMNPVVEYILNTPSHHRVHHGVNPKYIDKNHAGTFILFDRWFGTFQEEDEEVVYGITQQPNSWNPVWVNFEYWITLFKEAFRVAHLKDFFFTLFRSADWRQNEPVGIALSKKVTSQTFQKYHTEISGGLTNYVFFQFAIVLLGATLFLITESKQPFLENLWLKIFVSALIVFSLVNIGGIFERKRWVLSMEYLRVVIISVLVLWLFKGAPKFLFIGIAAAVAVSISLLWFSKYRNEFSIAEEM